jgi:hypothetical protein
MTQISIDQQIEAIRKVTAEALKSKESALKILRDAGIIGRLPESNTKNSKEKKKG